MENTTEKSKEEATPAAQLIQPTEQPGSQSHEIIIVGTAHVSEKSVQEVVGKIEEVQPDIVAVELCPARYRAITGQEEEREIKISELLSGGKLYFLLVQWFLAYIQRKMGEEMGVKPGSEMLAAIEAAKKVGAKVALVDRDIGITIQRFWSAMSLLDKIRLVWSLLPAAFGRGEEEIDIDSITQADIVSQMISEFRKISPGAANVLVDERDAFIARNLHLLSKQGRVLAVVGAGHREGITRHLEHPERIPAMEGLIQKPGKKITAVKVFGVAFSLLILATIALVLISAQSSEKMLQAVVIWFAFTGGLSALGVVLARGHPLSALTALMVAWMTTLNPFVAAGWFAGMVEAWKLKPTVTDLKNLASADSFSQMLDNRLFKVIWVAALSNLGAMAGTFVGIYLIWRTLGLDIEALLQEILSSVF
ncbi:MAG: TraB/GumN family protein [Methanothrix sp.]|nr:TraB/GumN family protein [Methanothrix sp.]OYV10107.1 MAG: TraB family protein [Methanosaeta sp. NSP1]